MIRGMVTAALLCALSGVAFADNKEAAKEAYNEGKRHYDLGEYAPALEAFKKAYLNYEEPVFLFNTAQCYRALGDGLSAARTYRAFLRNWPKAPNREQVERIIAQLDAANAQQAAARASPPQDTLEPNKQPGTAEPSAEPKPHAPAEAQAKPTPPQPGESKPAVAAKTPSPPHDELTGMVEVVPNFDRPSGSAKPLKWWAWTLIAVAVGGVAAAAIIVGVTQAGGDKFTNTLPTLNVNNMGLQAVVHF